MRALAAQLARRFEAGEDVGPVGLFWPGLLVRSGPYMVLVVGHALRHLIPR